MTVAVAPGAASLALDGPAAARAAHLRADGLDADAVFLDAAAGTLDALVARHGRAHPHVVVASLPKSGSTWLNALLVAATGFRPYLLNTTGADTERSIDPLCVPMLLAGPTVGQEHMRASRANVAWLRALGVRPVVLVRSVPDLVVSTADHHEREPARGPGAHLPRSWATWPRARRLDFLVHFAVPWMLTLYASWCAAATALDVHWLRYEDLARDPAAALAGVLAHVGVEAPETRVREAVAGIDRGATRYNRARVGRGAEELGAARLDALRAIAAPYGRCCPLDRVGLA